ncbi:hypothetical protein D3C86_1289830 [compost metagenome]
MLGQFTDTQLRTVGAETQFRMREVQVIAPLHHMVGELVAQRISEAIRLTVVADHIEAGELRFFTGVFGKRRHRKVCAGAHNDAAVTLVEPFRLRADLAGRWLAALQAPLEDAHGVGHAGFNCAALLVHFVPG